MLATKEKTSYIDTMCEYEKGTLRIKSIDQKHTCIIIDFIVFNGEIGERCKMNLKVEFSIFDDDVILYHFPRILDSCKQDVCDNIYEYCC